MLRKSCDNDQQNSVAIECNKSRFMINKKTMIIKNERDVRDVYKISKTMLGEGVSGAVYKCVHRERGFVRAAKIVSKN